MDRAFLYIDILGFEKTVMENPAKVREIFQIIDSLKVHNEYNLKVIVFSDTVLVFTEQESLKINNYVNDLVEYTQELFYMLSEIDVFFKAAITFGEFNYSKMKNIEAYFGATLINTYHDTSLLEGFGLYIDKEICSWIRTYNVIDFDKEYCYVTLCSSLENLYSAVYREPTVDVELIKQYGDLNNLGKDLNFLSKIYTLKNEHGIEKVRIKYQKVYEIYKSILPLFFNQFEKKGFTLDAINHKFLENNLPEEVETKKMFSSLLKKLGFHRKNRRY